MKQVYPVIFTQLNDKKDTVLINVPDMDILTEGFGLSEIGRASCRERV